MNYPDGSMVCVGDLVWWNGGTRAGHIQGIMETKAEYQSWDMTEPFVFISNEHPFNPQMTMGIAYPASSFNDDGIGLLNSEERDALARAMTHAQDLFSKPHDAVSVSISVEEYQMVGWVFDFIEGSKIVGQVRVPAKRRG